MLTPLTINTYPLATGYNCPADAFVKAVYRGGRVPAYPADIIQRIAEANDHYSRMFSDDGRTVAGQMFEETNFLQFTGDVKPGQYNFGGLGATGGGVVGESYGTPEEGVLAVYAHRSAYYRGPKEHWPPELQPYWNASHRYQNIANAGFLGSCSRIGDLGNGKWAAAGNYAQMIVTRGNVVGDYMTGQERPLRLAVGAGHHNTSGGNPQEIALTGPITKQYVDTARAWGVDVRCYTPNDGLGYFPGDLHAAVDTVNQWSKEGWTPDVLLENHFQGLEAGSDAGRGFFVIYPDWSGDVDTYVTGIFAPVWGPVFATRTTLPKYGNGTMSEKRTGVGLAGDRLGVFSTTVGLRDVTHRMIIEHGCHTCPSDRAIIVGQDFNQHAVDSFFESWFNVEGRPFPTTPPAYVPSGPGGMVDGFYLVKPFWDAWQARGQYNHPDFGLIVSGMVLAPVDGNLRYIQFTEKGALACYPPGMPDGVPEGNPWFVRNVTPAERAEALAYARLSGLVGQDLL